MGLFHNVHLYYIRIRQIKAEKFSRIISHSKITNLHIIICLFLLIRSLYIIDRNTTHPKKPKSFTVAEFYSNSLTNNEIYHKLANRSSTSVAISCAPGAYAHWDLFQLGQVVGYRAREKATQVHKLSKQS